MRDVLGEILSPNEYEELHGVLSVAYEVEHLDIGAGSRRHRIISNIRRP